jgi:hypothetical protein
MSSSLILLYEHFQTNYSNISLPYVYLFMGMIMAIIIYLHETKSHGDNAILDIFILIVVYTEYRKYVVLEMKVVTLPNKLA